MDSSDDEGPSMFSVSVPDPAEDEEMVAAQAACILSADDVATATRVLRTLADTSAMSEDDAGSVALRDLRQALVSAHTRLKKRFFGGTSVGVHATRTMLKRRMRAEEQRQKMLDRRFVDNTGLRRSRIQKMAELEGEHGGAVPMLLDGVTDRAGDDDERRQTTDLTGRIGIVTGARVKIGYHAAMRLLRCGADVIVVTALPTDCARR
ncbi:hypothetical protein FNF28_06866 [Cafeteria roenbergensis]|uniref:Uncharacterized protein n=1 Tax=Cafeteria roenbergensis TaxID=33653 RepID=A0A5A8CQU6_CAFRO|nr:hypothetical protein FNF28_06866 [Cafeteria roenbergensis]